VPPSLIQADFLYTSKSYTLLERKKRITKSDTAEVCFTISTLRSPHIVHHSLFTQRPKRGGRVLGIAKPKWGARQQSVSQSQIPGNFDETPRTTTNIEWIESWVTVTPNHDREGINEMLSVCRLMLLYINLAYKNWSLHCRKALTGNIKTLRSRSIQL